MSTGKYSISCKLNFALFDTFCVRGVWSPYSRPWISKQTGPVSSGCLCVCVCVCACLPFGDHFKTAGTDVNVFVSDLKTLGISKERGAL